jgi:endo-1,4-beta-D-glucanase Y
MPITDNITGDSFVTYGDALKALSPVERNKPSNLFKYEVGTKKDSGGNVIKDVDNYDKIYWADTNPDDKPTKEAVAAKFKEIKEDFATKAYVRDRQKEYPDALTQLAYIYDHGIDVWKSEMIDPIKKRHPKKSTGSKK